MSTDKYSSVFSRQMAKRHIFLVIFQNWLFCLTGEGKCLLEPLGQRFCCLRAVDRSQKCEGNMWSQIKKYNGSLRIIRPESCLMVVGISNLRNPKEGRNKWTNGIYLEVLSLCFLHYTCPRCFLSFTFSVLFLGLRTSDAAYFPFVNGSYHFYIKGRCHNW